MRAATKVSILYDARPTALSKCLKLNRIAVRPLYQRMQNSSKHFSSHSLSSKPTLTYSSPYTARLRQIFRQASTTATNRLKKTGLYDLHVSNGAKMVPFAGYWMPVQYDGLKVGESHKWTREKASLFDVGHMVQHRFKGIGAATLLKKLTPASIDSLPVGRSTLSVFLHLETGGIVDDTIITRLGGEEFYVVTNAACRDKDVAYLTEHISAYQTKSPSQPILWEIMEDWGLVALQGPLSASILSKVLADGEAANLDKLYFGQSRFYSVKLNDGQVSPPLLVSRAGYTGEDGFEISIPPNSTIAVTETILQAGDKEDVQLAGLGARDSLRLEAGMCLYGHDLDDTTTPVEAGLGWVVGKERRSEGGFFGDNVVLSQLKQPKNGGVGVTRRRVGMIVEGAPAREGAEIVSETGEVIGKVTSGCPSPTLGKNIAIGYIKEGYHKSETKVGVMVRGKKREATITKMPFVASKYWKEG